MGTRNTHSLLYEWGEIGIKEEEKDLGIYVNASMKFGKQCAEAAKKANRVFGIIKSH